MSRARVARRIAAGAAYGGGGIGLLGVAAVGVLLAEAALARRSVGNGVAPLPPGPDGRYGRSYDTEEPLRLALLGDSTAAGQGVRRTGQTPGALLSSGLAAVAERPVDLRVVALPGARSDDLERQVSLLLSGPPSGTPDVCVIMIGANDVTHRVPATESVRCLAAAVRRLRTAGAEVVVGTCPDLGTIEPVYQPLRWLARRASRQLAAAQTIVVVEQGGRTVSLGDLLGPEFEANPREMFGVDNFHPSAEGYATAAMAVLPTVCAALSIWPEPERIETARHETLLPVALAAAEAASEAGTEVAGTEVAATRTPWALLKHRRRWRIPVPNGNGYWHGHGHGNGHGDGKGKGHWHGLGFGHGHESGKGEKKEGEGEAAEHEDRAGSGTGTGEAGGTGPGNESQGPGGSKKCDKYGKEPDGSGRTGPGEPGTDGGASAGQETSLPQDS